MIFADCKLKSGDAGGAHCAARGGSRKFELRERWRRAREQQQRGGQRDIAVAVAIQCLLALVIDTSAVTSQRLLASKDTHNILDVHITLRGFGATQEQLATQRRRRGSRYASATKHEAVEAGTQQLV